MVQMVQVSRQIQHFSEQAGTAGEGMADRSIKHRCMTGIKTQAITSVKERQQQYECRDKDRQKVRA